MAKKNFKSGLDSLLEETIKKQAAGAMQKNIAAAEQKTESTIAPSENFTQTEPKVAPQNASEDIEKLKFELKLWRTGKLSIDLFHKSLADKNLRYDEATNSILPA